LELIKSKLADNLGFTGSVELFERSVPDVVDEAWRFEPLEVDIQIREGLKRDVVEVIEG
jgi:hypothetical protein